ncbi:MAG: hypothetical protein ACTSR3_01185 [Candidatus Helarchaeota archaeon]
MNKIVERTLPITRIFDDRKEKLIEDQNSFEFPYICEFPIVLKDEFRRFRRAIQIDIATSMLDELGFGREIEGKESAAIFGITIISPTLTDLKEIVYQVRQMCFNMPTPDDNYVNLVPSTLLRHFVIGRGRVMGIMGIACNLVGRQIT